MRQKKFSDKKDVFKSLLKTIYYGKKTPREVLEKALQVKEGVGVSFAFLLDEFGWDVVERLYDLVGDESKLKLQSKQLLLEKACNAAKFVLCTLKHEDHSVSKEDIPELLFFVKLLKDRPSFFLKLASHNKECLDIINSAVDLLNDLDLF